MTVIDSRKDKIVNSVVAEARRRAKGKTDLVETFVRAFYAGVAPQQLAERTPEALAGAALSALDTLAKRKPGESNVRVLNPDAKRDGWSTPNTVIELVTDDKPFLVDSASAAVGQLGATIEMLVHPILKVRRDAHGNLIEIVSGEPVGA